jgi:hypothetical protein
MTCLEIYNISDLSKPEYIELNLIMSILLIILTFTSLMHTSMLYSINNKLIIINNHIIPPNYSINE